MNETSKVTPFTVVSWKKACECAERWKDLEDCIEKQISVEHAGMWAHAVLALGLGGCFFFVFFLLNIFTQDYPLGWVPLQMRGPARNIAQTYKNNIYTKHDMYNYKNIYTGPGP